MVDIISWLNNDQFDKNDFGAFMREGAKQSKPLQQERDKPLSEATHNISSEMEALKYTFIRSKRKEKEEYESNAKITEKENPAIKINKNSQGTIRKRSQYDLPP